MLWESSPSFKAFIEHKLGEVPVLVIREVLEWVVRIVLLFMDGLVASVSDEFSKMFNLRVPCLLCTRVDHVLVHRDPSFYYNESMCEDHKKNISSLAYCHMHKKLSDIRCMCQGCLLSFATGKDSDCDEYKPLVGTLNQDAEDDKMLLANSLKNDDEEMSYCRSYSPRWCSCCGEPLKSKVPKKRHTRNLSMNMPTAPPQASRLRNTKSKRFEDNASTVENQSSREVKSIMAPFPPNIGDAMEGAIQTPTFAKGNKFLGVTSEAAQQSPQWANRGVMKPLIMEPNDTSSLNEEDGDTLNRLKRQLHQDQSTLQALQQELDKERSAADVAANNAMAMITRLQAEKAAVQMEALQYQRMMDEQAEYDEEALQFLRDMILKRWEEIKALESELEMYREKYGPIKKVGSEICEVDIEDDCQDMKSPPFSRCGSSSESDNNETEDFQHPIESDKGRSEEESSLNFEGERSHLLTLLADLEEKMSADEGTTSSDSTEATGNENKAKLAREVSLIKEQLRAIEAESDFLKHAAMTLQKGGEGMKLLAEIAQHLSDLSQTGTSPMNDADA